MTAGGVVLHMGISKTGSTALQATFARNRERLASAGVCYPASHSDRQLERGRVISGNGSDHLKACLAPGSDQLSAEQALARFLRVVDESPEGQQLLFSSEALIQFDAQRLQRLHHELRHRGRPLRAALFLRSISGHAWSAYLQFVKARQLVASFTEFTEGRSVGHTYRLQLAPRLRTLRAELGTEGVTVLNFDQRRDCLLEAFLAEVFGIPVPAGMQSIADSANRSPSLLELQWLLHLNRNAEPDTAKRLSEALMSRPRVGPAGRGITEHHVRVLAERFGDQVRWVEAHFPEAGWEVGEPDPAASAIVATAESELRLLDFLVHIAQDRVTRARA